jgi:hypothetical protein
VVARWLCFSDFSVAKDFFGEEEGFFDDIYIELHTVELCSSKKLASE